MKRNIALLVRSFVLVMLAVPLLSLAGGAMKMTAVSFPLPTDSEPVPLTGLSYGGFGGLVEVTSVRLEIVSKEGEDPVRAVWALTGRNSKPQHRRVQLSIFLLDAAKKHIASAKKTALFKGADAEQEFVLEMKVKAKTWARAQRVYLRVDFLSR